MMLPRDNIFKYLGRQFFRKMVDDGAEAKPDVLASLFTVTAKKAAPQYDYSIVPSRYGLFCFYMQISPWPFISG